MQQPAVFFGIEGLVILALLGIEVPLNMGFEIRDMRAITKYLFWGSTVVMAAHLWGRETESSCGRIDGTVMVQLWGPARVHPVRPS